MLPRSIASRMKSGERSIADYFDEATVVFIDMVGFTSFSSEHSPENVIALLNNVFSKMDRLTDEFGLEKIKTIGDCYMAVCGVPIQHKDHLERSIKFCLAVLKEMESIEYEGKKVEFKIGMETGPAIAGIIGEKRFLFDLWGDTVNVASRMESNGKPGYIQTTQNVAEKMKGIFDFQSEGVLDIKGKGAIEVFTLKN